MGGDYYDRPVQQTTSNIVQVSQQAEQLFKTSSLSKDLDPKKYKQRPLETNHLNPIVFALDVTGSMGEWTKVIYDKMPMFYGQIMIQKYLTDPAISFCAIGDHLADDVPLQVAPFAQGRTIDEILPKFYLEAGGGGNYHESYELASYFYLKNCNLTNPNVSGFFFVTGDERYFDILHNKNISEYLDLTEPIIEQNSTHVWKQLAKKFNVFHLHKPYFDKQKDTGIVNQWIEALGRNKVLIFETAKACVDVMLGAIAIASGIRTLETYTEDMQFREQGKERIMEVRKALMVMDPQYDTIEEEKVEEVKVDTFKIKDAPDEFYCPITQDLMEDPYMAMDGFTYEKSNILSWYKKHETSPMTGLKVEKAIIPNASIKNLIANYNRNKVKELN